MQHQTPSPAPLSEDKLRERIAQLGLTQFVRVRTVYGDEDFDYVGLAALDADGNLEVRTNSVCHTIPAQVVAAIEPINPITEESRALEHLLAELNRVNPDPGTGWYVELHDLTSAAMEKGARRRFSVWKLTDAAATEAGWLA